MSVPNVAVTHAAPSNIRTALVGTRASFVYVSGSALAWSMRRVVMQEDLGIARSPSILI